MFTNILVPLDGSSASKSGLDQAIRMVTEQGGTLRLLHVVQSPLLDYGYSSPVDRKDVIAALCQNGKNILDDAETTARQQGLAPECVMFESNSGPAADVILEQARQWPASLIVMGTHARRGTSRIGNDTAQVVGDALVPVLLVRATARASKDPEHRPVGHASVA